MFYSYHKVVPIAKQNLDLLVYKHLFLPDIIICGLGGNHLHFLPAVLAFKFAFQQANRLQPFYFKDFLFL